MQRTLTWGRGRTRGQNCFCCDKISDKYLFPVNFILLCLGSYAFAFLHHYHYHYEKENFPAPGPNDITLLLLSKSCFSVHNCTNYFYCSSVHLLYFLDWLDWLGDWLSNVSFASEAGENMPPLESWLKWYEPNDQNIFFVSGVIAFKMAYKENGNMAKRNPSY